MFKRILVALDGSVTAESILPAVTSLAQLFGSWVTLCSIISHEKSPFLLTNSSFLETIELESKQALTLYLHKIQSRLESKGIKIDIVIKTGNPSHEIIQLAENTGYDLLAFATRGRSGITRWILGSVADHIIGSVTTPILLISPKADKEYSLDDPHKINSIIAPLDGSRLAESILPIAESISIKSNTKIDLLQVVPTIIQVYLGIEPQAYPMDVLENLEDRAYEYLSTIESSLKNRGVTARSKLVEGDVSSSIIDYCSKLDHSLITMTTRGYTGFSRWVLGSVADKIIRDIGEPVLLVKI